MKLNIYNNFKAFYYNTLVNFYLYFNTLVPYYDDVILSLSITSFKNIINNSSISLKTINQNRMMQLLYSLNDKDKIIVDDDGYIIIYYDKDAKICAADAEEHEATEEDADVNEEDANDAENDEDADEALPSNPEEVAFEPEASPSNPEEVAFEPETIPSNPEEVAFEPETIPSNPEEDADAIREPYNSSDKKNN